MKKHQWLAALSVIRKLITAQSQPHDTMSRLCQKGRYHSKNGAPINTAQSPYAQAK